MMDLLNTYMRSAYQGALYKGPPTPVDTSKSDKAQKEMSILDAIMSMAKGDEAPAGTTTVGGKSYSPVYGPTGGYGYTGGKTQEDDPRGVSRSIGYTVFTPGMSAGYTRPAGTTVSGGQSHKPFG